MSAHYDRETFMAWAKDEKGVPQPVPSGWFAELGYAGKVGGEFRSRLNADIREHHRLFVEDGFIDQIIDLCEMETFYPKGQSYFKEEFAPVVDKAKRTAISVMASLMDLTVIQLWAMVEKRGEVVHESFDYYRGERRSERRLTIKYKLSKRV